MTAQLDSSLTPDEWSQRIKQALVKAAATPHSLVGEALGCNRLSVRRLILNQADEILALKAKGIGYRAIAQQLTESGIPVNEAGLRRYICDYRKRKSQTLPAQEQQLSARERLQNSLANNRPIR